MEKNSMFKMLGCKELNFLFLALAVLASLISAYFSLDALAYQNIFHKYSATGWGDIFDEVQRYELFFLVLAKIFNGWHSFFWFFSIALMSIFLKLKLIRVGSKDFYISLSLYLLYFFVLQDGTGIRVSLAIAIAYWGAYFLARDRFCLSFVIVVFSALFFHYSLIFFMLIFFFKSENSSFLLIISWPLLIFVWWLGIDFTTVISSLKLYVDPSFPGFNKFFSYASMKHKSSVPYSSQFILLYVSSVIVFYRYKDELSRFELICFNSVFMSMVFLGLFASAEGLQNRVSEIFRFGLIFVFPFYYRFLLEMVKRDWLAKIFLGVLLIGYFYYFVLRAGLLIFPESWSYL